MNGWFLAIIILGVLNVGINMAKHGEVRKDKYNFFGALIGIAIQFTLIYMAIQAGL